ncbi:hypothetical protein C3L33_16170, partial [Rhododendron williamsianum]
MNFRSQGYFYGEDQNQNQNQIRSNNTTTSGPGKLPFSYNSSSSSQPHKHQRATTTSSTNSWLENNKYGNPRRTPSAAAEEISSTTTTTRYSTAATNLELMDASPSFLRHNVNSDDDDVVMRRAEDYEGDNTTTAGVGQLAVEVEREHMFDKVVTPSDVGKLNRLVIPKQHAEKYFPLDSSSSDKGLLLNFEDRNGKPWRFRYSYWNSSQSYVMTKGWSRFVKEKKLDAGDIVSFQRGLGELGKDRLFIDWRRRPEMPQQRGGLLIPPIPPHHHQHYLSFQRMPTYTQPSATSPPLFLQTNAPLRDYSHYHHHPNASAYVNQPQYSTNTGPYGYGYGGSGGGPYGSYNTMGSPSHPCSSSVIYLRSTAASHVTPQQVQAGMVQLQSSSGGGGGGMDIGAALPMVFESVPVVQGKAAAKRLRLFGVNMDCPISESDECGDVLSSSSSSTTMPNASTMAPWPHPPHNIHPLQLRLYNGSSPLPAMHPDKGNASNKSLDFDI